jgi:hypothetical protein
MASQIQIEYTKLLQPYLKLPNGHYKKDHALYRSNYKQNILYYNRSSINEYHHKSLEDDFKGNLIWTSIDNAFIRHNDEIQALKTQVTELKKEFKKYQETSTKQITDLQELNKLYQTKLDETINLITEQIKIHETNIKELVEKIKIEQEALKQQIEESLKTNKILTNTNDNYVKLSGQFVNLIDFLRYVFTNVNMVMPELMNGVDLEQLSINM